MKKGETLHHIAYTPEFKVKVSRGAHLTLVGFERMNPTEENIKEIEDFIKAVLFIKWRKISEWRKKRSAK